MDTLIEYYQEENRGLVTRLKKPYKGLAPPHDTRRHGKTNLLHRATLQVKMFFFFFFSFFQSTRKKILHFNCNFQKNYTIVSELLECGYRSLDAKNQLGQTAVHLAAKDGTDDILTKLIQSYASVNCRDTEGYTPLHVSKLKENE